MVAFWIALWIKSRRSRCPRDMPVNIQILGGVSRSVFQVFATLENAVDE